jgi:ParB family chromosome partitioning protein
MTQLTTVPFSKLVASDTINARPATKEGLEELAANIKMLGLISPLVVRPSAEADKFEIIDGRRRFAALALLVKSKELKRAHDVPVVIRNETNGDALEASLAANMMRLGMHPVDEYVAFARLAEQGRSDEEIAATFAIDVRRVRQRKALGTLAPAIREAYRKGKLDQKQAEAFAEHADQGVQESVYETLRRGPVYMLAPAAIRRELLPDRTPVAACAELQLVGEPAYLDAGGTITEGSLFEDTRYVDDVALAKKLARDFLRAECGKLQAAGWAWALPALDGDDPFEFDFEHVRGENGDDQADDYTDEEKARSGCLVDGRSGKLFVYRGLVRDGENALEADEDAGDDAPGLGAEIDDEEPAPRSIPADDPFAISGALTETITGAQSLAVAQLVRDDFELSVRLALAALLSSRSPARITCPDPLLEPRDFADEWQRVSALTFGEAMRQFAVAVAGTVSMVALNAWTDRKGESALVASLPAEKYLFWMREAFDPADYFKRAGKETTLAALEEIVEAGAGAGLAPIDVLADMKKGDLAAAAAGVAKACGWLPPQLRHPAYALEVAQRTEAAE